VGDRGKIEVVCELKMKAEKFDPQFEDDVDITASLDLSKARRVLQKQSLNYF
jgi:hypothetical protein